MATFISRNIKLRIWGEKGAWDASFAPIGRYSTNDDKIIGVLREHPLFNKKFAEANMPKMAKSNVIQGLRSAATQPVIDKDNKLLRVGELRAKLLKNDGAFRKDAPDDLINELKELQGELGV